MAEFGAFNRWFGKLLDGRIPEERVNNRKTSEKVAPIETDPVLQTEVTRRGLLGGAAVSAATTATGGSQVLTESAPVIIQQGVKEAAAVLGAHLGNTMHALDYVASQTQAMQEAFKIGLPLNEKGQISFRAFIDIAVSNLQLIPKELKIEDLGNVDVIAEAFRVSGGPHESHSEKGKNPTATIKQAGEILQRITGLKRDSTIADVQRVVQQKTVEMAKTILKSPDLIPAIGSRERHLVFKNIQDLLQRDWKVEGESDLLNAVDSLEREAEKAYKAMEAVKKGERVQDPREAHERSNRELQRRSPIMCSVVGSTREARDDRNAQVFLIRPEIIRKGFSGLTRMHIQHLRQQLTKGQEKTLDNFDPADTQVETLGNFVRVSTTDEKFAKYLSSFIGKQWDQGLKIPNRLQTVLSS